MNSLAETLGSNSAAYALIFPLKELPKTDSTLYKANDFKLTHLKLKNIKNGWKKFNLTEKYCPITDYQILLWDERLGLATLVLNIETSSLDK